MNLLIDIGNSRIKWAAEQKQQLVSGQSLINTVLNRQRLVKLWKYLPKPQHIALACVSASYILEQVLAVISELWPETDIIHARSEACAFGVYNAYPQPEKLGVDRWLALIASRRYYQTPLCIVDCGTAITVDLMDGEGRHQGGLISPGLTLMKKALANGAQALEFNPQCYRLEPANFTEAAIDSGALYAAIGLIESVLARHAKNYRLILTGGDAGRIAPALSATPVIDDDLVLRGLALILKDRP